MGFPISFYIALALLLAFGVDLFLRRREDWALPVGMVYATVFGWHFVDFLAYRERYEAMPDLFIAYGFWQIAIFLVCFRILAPVISRRMSLGVFEKIVASGGGFFYDWLFIGTVTLWVILFTMGLVIINVILVIGLFLLMAGVLLN